MTGRLSDRILGTVGNRRILWLGLASFLLIVILPPAILLVDALSLLVRPDPALPSPLNCLSGRHLQLLAQSLLYSLAVSAFASTIGFLAASFLWQWRRPPGVWLRWLVLPLIVIPPYVHAEAWTGLPQLLSQLLGGMPSSWLQLSGWPGAIFIETMACLPITTGLALLGLTAIDPSLIDSGLTFRPAGAVLSRIVLPLIRPQLVAGASLVFIYSLTDYSVPSLFQQNLYALDLFAGFSQHGSPGITMWHSLPQLLPAVLAVWLAISSLKSMIMSKSARLDCSANAIDWPLWFRLLQTTAVLILAMQILVPLLSLIGSTGAFDRILTCIAAASSEIETSLLVAVISGLASLPIALAMAVQICRGASPSSSWWLVCFMPLAIPAPLTGIGLIHLWNHPWLESVYGTPVILVLAALARFTPIAVLILVAYLRHLDPKVFDAAAVFQTSNWQTWCRIRLPLIAPGLSAAGSVVAALSLGELGATLLVAPPARATLTMRIFNYMHYGSSASVAGLSLFMAATVLLLGIISTWGLYWLGFHLKQRRGDSR